MHTNPHVGSFESKGVRFSLWLHSIVNMVIQHAFENIDFMKRKGNTAIPLCQLATTLTPPPTHTASLAMILIAGWEAR